MRKKRNDNEIYSLTNFDSNVSTYNIQEPKNTEVDYLFSIKNKIILQPDFQRDFIWPKPKQKELIKSIWSGIPLPMFYFSETEDGTLEVVDGQQRLTTLFGFLDKNCIDKNIRSKIIDNINLKKDNKPIPLSLIKDKIRKSSIYIVKISENSLTPKKKFEIFQKLNQGAVSLKPQELRNCIFQEYLPNLNNNLKKNTHQLQRLVNKEFNRMRGEELVLRFYVINTQGYDKDISKSLDDFDRFKVDFADDKLKRINSKFNKFIRRMRKIFPNHQFEVLKKDESLPKNRYDWKAHIFSDEINQGLFHLFAYYLPKYEDNQFNRIPITKIRKTFLDLLKNKKFIDLITGSGTNQLKKIKKSIELFEILFIKKCLGDYSNKSKRNISSQAKKTILENLPFCYLCYGQLKNLKGVAGEHIGSYNEGFDSELRNSLLAHRECNSEKHIKTLEDYRRTKNSIIKRTKNKNNISNYLQLLKKWNSNYPLDQYKLLRNYARKDKKIQ